MACGIYGIHNTDTNKWYIGQSQDIEKRWTAHRWGLAHGLGESIKLLRAWKKYGESAFEWVVLEECVIEDLDARERFWIIEKDSFHNGYNLTTGGGGMRGYQQSEETRKKRSAALEKVMQSEGYRKLRARLSKEMWERAEYREKILQIRAKVMATPEYKETISRISKERYNNKAYRDNYLTKIRAYYSDPKNKEVIISRNRLTARNMNRNKKIGEAHAERYRNNPDLRKKVSEETTLRWANPEYRERTVATQKESAQNRSTPVLQVETGKVFASMENASIAVGGRNKAGICDCCKGKRDKASGFHWRYANETEQEWNERRTAFLSQLIPSRRRGHTPVRVECLDNGEVYASCKEAAEALGLDASSISRVCRGKTKTTKGFHFIYITDKNQD